MRPVGECYYYFSVMTFYGFCYCDPVWVSQYECPPTRTYDMLYHFYEYDYVSICICIRDAGSLILSIQSDALSEDF